MMPPCKGTTFFRDMQYGVERILTMLSIWFCSGCVLMGLGIVGEYIGKIYIETKERPRYNIESILMD